MTNAETWDRIYEDQRSSLVAFATMVVGSRQAGEDIVQECFTRMLASPPRQLDSPAAYLRVAVVNQCKRHFKTSARTTPLDPDDLRPWIDETHLDLLDAIGRLSSRRRTAVLLRYYLDLPVTEVAELMACKPSTVSSLLNRAYRDLKEYLP